MSNLLKPITVGGLPLHNRLVMPPMATSKADPKGKISKEMLQYYDEKSAGGHISLIIIEHCYVAPEGKSSEKQLSLMHDEAITNLKQLSDLIHGNGSKTMLQIDHAGSATTKEIINSIPVAPSAVQNPRKGSMPRELERHEILHIVDAFKNAAVRAKKAGFDGVEIHSAHGYLLNQFLSPLTNIRTDEYGGELLGRIKIHLDIIQSIKAALGPDFPIIIRLGASDFMEGGTTLEDSCVAARAFEGAGVCALDVSGGLSGPNVTGLTGQGYFAPLAEAIKSAVSIPVILTGGITEPDAAENLLNAGKTDLVGVGRAILRDSRWAEKAIRKLEEKE